MRTTISKFLPPPLKQRYLSYTLARAYNLSKTVKTNNIIQSQRVDSVLQCSTVFGKDLRLKSVRMWVVNSTELLATFLTVGQYIVQ